MPTLTTIVRWLDAHALSIALYLALVAGILRALYAMLSRVLSPYPRARAAVEAVAAMAPDVLRFVGQVYALLTGRALPSTGALPASPVVYHPPVIGGRTDDVALPVLAEKHDAVTVSETREEPVTVYAPAIGSPLRAVTVSHRPPPPASADPLLDSARASVRAELGDLMPPRPDADGQRGSVDVRSLLAVVVGLSVVLPLGVALMGCPRMPPVSGCQPMAQTCIADSPHVCSASQRWHRAGGLTCREVGGSCAVVGGRAFCAAPMVDAGAALAADGGL